MAIALMLSCRYSVRMAKILVVDDDSSIRMFLSATLKRAGHDIDTQPNGVEALEWLKSGKAPDYDLMLADIVMPGMDGIELAQKAGKEMPEMRVMFITGFAAVTMGENKGQNTHARILSKPFHLKDIVMHVSEVLAA